MRFLVPLLVLFVTSTCAAAPTRHEVRLETEVSATSIAEVLSGMERMHDYILLRIDSLGGSTAAGEKLIRTIEDSKVPVVCVVDGTAASMAALILESCHVRVMLKRSSLMIHEIAVSEGEMDGQETDWRNLAERLRTRDRGMAEFLAAHIHASPAAILDRIRGGAEWWLSGEEALQVGAVDLLVDSMADARLAAKAASK